MITIDERRGVVVVERDGETVTHKMDSPEAFAAASDAWLRAGWWVKHVYTFTWLGRPVVQLPEDLLRLQELVYRVRPDVIIETGVAHGGGLVFHASLCRLLGHGRVIGIDIDIRDHNRTAIEAHPLSPLITLIEGNSVDPDIVAQVRSMVEPGMRVMVILDSNHSADHVGRELRAYAPLVTPDSWIVAMDGHMMALAAGGPRSGADWAGNNPRTAIAEFLAANPAFIAEDPPFLFNESALERGVSYSAGGYLRRVA
jgi:cephalosporin hydroxylase